MKVVPAVRANPKSNIFNVQSLLTTIFDGFRSLKINSNYYQTGIGVELQNRLFVHRIKKKKKKNTQIKENLSFGFHQNFIWKFGGKKV